MLIIKVNATDSTNLHLKRLLKESELPDLTVLVAGSQEKGRGQAGTSWTSEPGRNLTLSVLKRYKDQKADRGFLISTAVSLALIGVFRKLEIPELSIKWPNDIMSGRRKICGILIENTLKGSRLAHSIIGIGLNVNQESFEGLPRASSLFRITGKTYELDFVLELLISALQAKLGELESPLAGGMTQEYDQHLFLKDRSAQFKVEGGVISGTIKGVTSGGRLLLQGDDGQVQTYGLKEIAYLL